MGNRRRRAGVARGVFTLFLALALGSAGGTGARERTITVDLGAPGTQISPYIYGQFIEHLGRCIRGGIWAEMLRDRKFLLEPGKSWEVVRPEGAALDAFHDTAGAWAGEHCMALEVRDAGAGRCGLRQGGLGLIEGRAYVGYAILASVGEPAEVEIRLAWGDGPGEGQAVTLKPAGPAYRKFPFAFRAGATTDAASLSLTLGKPSHLWVACLSLMPAENRRGLRPDTLELIRRLAPPITRWPGGNFVSGYQWKDGIGDRDRRPPRWERAWNDVESNDFGVDEFLAFCAEVGTEPYIAVNTGLGSVADAVDQLEYVNGSPESRWGAERARNGHPEPYRVKWWGIGNEMYGKWQLGNIPVERYARRHNAFVAALRARDPDIRVVAVGSPGRWNDVIVPACADFTDLLSGHHYTRRQFRVPFSPGDARTYRERFRSYSGDVAAGVRRLVEDFRPRQGKGRADVDRLRLAVDEWGIVRDWDRTPDAPGIGSFEHYYTLGDAIAVARGLHELIRAADVVAMANWAQTVNVIGAIKTSRSAAVLDPAGHVLALYRARLGGAVVPVEVDPDLPVDAVAGLNRQTGAVSLALVNFSPDQDVAVALRLRGGPRPASTRGWRIAASDLGATNVPGKPESVTTTGLGAPRGLEAPIPLPRHSITLLEIRGAAPGSRPAASAVLFEDRFEGDLAAGWSWVRENRAAWEVGGGSLRIRVEPGSVWGRGNNARNLLVRPLPGDSTADLIAEVTVIHEAGRKFEQAGIVWYRDDRNMVKLVKEQVEGKTWIIMGREEGDRGRLVGQVPFEGARVDLRFRLGGGKIRGQFRRDETGEWRDVGTCDLPGAGGRPGISLQAYNGAAGTAHRAEFHGFRIFEAPD